MSDYHYHGASDEGEDVLGGGIAVDYFLTENVGFQVEAAWAATGKTLHSGAASVIYRVPFKNICLAPYVLAGGGGTTNSTSQGTWHVGAGIDYRFESFDCMGLFVEGRYTWGTQYDFASIRAGVKLDLEGTGLLESYSVR